MNSGFGGFVQDDNGPLGKGGSLDLVEALRQGKARQK
jgi:hypothetical protein